MFLESLTIDQMMDTIANWDSDEGEIVAIHPVPPISAYNDAPEAQNDANLEEE